MNVVQLPTWYGFSFRLEIIIVERFINIVIETFLKGQNVGQNAPIRCLRVAQKPRAVVRSVASENSKVNKIANCCK